MYTCTYTLLILFLLSLLLNLTLFPLSPSLSLPSSSFSLRVELLPQACNSVNVLRSFLGREKTNSEGCDLWSGFASKSSSLSLIDVNYLLYRCDVEERADGEGGGVYDVPDIGSMTYCGLQVRGKEYMYMYSLSLLGYY